MEIKGTTSKKLIGYIERVIDYLELSNADALIEIEILKECAAQAGGYCHGDDNDILVEIARYSEGVKYSTSEIMQNLAHELIHAKQIAEGRLVNHGFVASKSNKGNDLSKLDYKWEWEGKEFINTPYNDHPWEHEAYNLEESVYLACK